MEGKDERQADSVDAAQGIVGLANVKGFLKPHASITSSLKLQREDSCEQSIR